MRKDLRAHLARTATGVLLGLTSLHVQPAAAQHGAHSAHGASSGRQHASGSGAAPLAAAAAELPSVRWNALARGFMGGAHGGGTGLGTRPLAVLSVAQALAAASAEPQGAPARTLAVAAASDEIVRTLLPASEAAAAAALDADRAAARRAGLDDAALARADSLGRAAAARVLAHARSDGDAAAWRGSLPAGRGVWTSAAGMQPLGATWGAVRPWVLARADQFRPAAPPAMGTPEFARALDEVRAAVAGLTPAQRASAERWAAMPMPGYWNEVAAGLIARERLADARALKVLTALNVTLMDANIACFEAKYHYWGIRPSQADTTIALPVPLPNFPAYPSGHACLSEAAATVLGHYFPAERAALQATSNEVSMARLYGGVHYRHDNEVGAEMGRKVAQAVVAAMGNGAAALVGRRAGR